ncbi:MAG: response regulator transcription factor [Bacteroidota bacterium]
MTRRKEAVQRGVRNKVFLVDDHPIVRLGMRELINQQHDLAVSGEAEDARTALERIPVDVPDVAVVDISLKGMDGLELIKRIKAQYPQVKTLVVSMHPASLYAERAFRAGAHGYIMKQEANESLIAAIRRVLEGKMYVSESYAGTLLHKLAKGGSGMETSVVSVLSDRELEVFRLIGEGHGTREIAELLQLSMKTIETYREHIKGKLILKDAPDLVQHASQWVREQKQS